MHGVTMKIVESILKLMFVDRAPYKIVELFLEYETLFTPSLHTAHCFTMWPIHVLMLIEFYWDASYYYCITESKML